MTSQIQTDKLEEEETYSLLESIEPGSSEIRQRTSSTLCHKIHVLLLYAIIITLMGILLWPNSSQSKLNLYEKNTPLWDLVEHETVVFLDNIHELSQFQGPPDHFKDALWDGLYRNTSTTVIPSDRAKRLPNRTMVAPGTQNDGIIFLEVFHQLHCLNAPRKSLYPQRFPDYAVFFPNGSRNPEISIHHDHCVDRIRQATMCDANLGASFWRWNETLGKWSINMRTTQTCRNFDKIRLWAVERNLFDWDPKALGSLTSG